MRAALRFGNPNAKTKAEKPLESLTTFKPFTVRELEYDVWDLAQAKNDNFLQIYEEFGLIPGKNGGNGQKPAQAAYDQPYGGGGASIGNTRGLAMPLPVNMPTWDLNDAFNKRF